MRSPEDSFVEAPRATPFGLARISKIYLQERYQAAWRLRGFENFMIDMVDRVEMADYLLDQLTSMLIENALILARAGIDILLLDDDVAMPTGLMISPDTWRRHFKDRLARVINIAVATGRISLCPIW